MNNDKYKCNIMGFIDAASELAEEIILKNNKTPLEVAFIYRFTLMTLNAFVGKNKQN